MKFEFWETYIYLKYLFYNFIEWLSLCVEECSTLKIQEKNGYVGTQALLVFMNLTCLPYYFFSNRKQRIKASLVYKVHLHTQVNI